MFDSIFSFSDLDDLIYEEKVCPLCKTDLRRYKRTGRLGCSNCYVTFKDDLAPTIKRIHGNTKHKGKFPRNHRLDEKHNIEKLKIKLQDAVKKEDYLVAAEINDLIKKIENKKWGDVYEW